MNPNTIDNLKARVDELEQTLQAIRDGQIDSLFIPDDNGVGEIYTVSSADKPYRLMIERMAEGAVTLGEDGVVDYANPAIATMLGVGPSQMLGRSLVEWVAHEDRDRIATLLRGVEVRAERCHLVGARPDPIPVKMSLSPLSSEEGNSAAYAIITDLRDEGQLERLVSADKRKDEFLAMLAHELRNPLAPIQSALVLLNDEGDRHSDTQRRAVKAIERQMQRLVHLVDDLLDVARIRNAAMRIEREPVSLSWIIDAAVESCRDIIREREHNLRLSVDAPETMLRGDRLRLVQVFTNLLTNAAKYTPPAGEIQLRVYPEGPYIRFDITDNGEGIAAENLESLFELFAQADRTLDRSAGGLGLGLSLVRTLVELHGGRVAATSDGVGLGSTFSVWLLQGRGHGVDESTPAAPPTAATSEPDGGLDILVVDDNRDAADMLSLLLEAHGHTVQTAYDGEAAVESATPRGFDLIFLDIGLPGLDGYQVAQRIRGEGQSKTTLLVALTGYGTKKDREATTAAGFDGHLVKPVQEVDLKRVLGDARRRRGAVQAQSI